MQVHIDSQGTIRCLYAETLDLPTLGNLSISRASHVEPTETGDWTADLTPIHGPVLGPFPHRSEALAAEIAWIDRHWPTLAAH